MALALHFGTELFVRAGALRGNKGLISMKLLTRVGAVALSFALLAPPALAQTSEEAQPLPQEAVDAQGDTISIGVGGLYAPTYEGSDDYGFAPALIIRGRVSNFNFFTRGTSGYFDLAREAPGTKSDFLIGPMVNLRFDRSRSIKDPVVARLGKLDMAVEAGGFVGYGRNGLLNPYDYAQVRLDFVHDVSGTHDGYVFSPTFEYGTPLSHKTYVGLAASADYASGKFADTYYSVDTAGALRSGLPVYDARHGFKNARFTLLANQMLTGDLVKGGLSLFALGSYSRMLGDFKDSPLVALRGNPDQWLGGLGLAYTF
jgi:outer membrane protein